MEKQPQKPIKIIKRGAQATTLATTLAIGFGPNIGCGGGAKAEPVEPAKNDPYLTVVPKANTTASHQSGYRKTGETVTVKYTADEGYILDCPGHTVVMNGNQTVTCGHTVEKAPEPTKDTYDTDFAIRDALESLLSVWEKEIQSKELTPQQQQTCSEQLEKIYIEAFAKDSYAKHLPFDSAILEKVFEHVDFEFPRSSPASSDLRNTITISTGDLYPDNVGLVIHEVGHVLGLGEGLTCLLVNIFIGRDMSDKEYQYLVLENQIYTFVYDYLLLIKVGDTKFWEKVYETRAETYQDSEKKYGEMWDENMTVVNYDGNREPLVTFRQMLQSRGLVSHENAYNGAPFYKESVDKFKRFAGMKDSDGIQARLAELGKRFEDALNGNRYAKDDIQDFYKLIGEFCTAENIYANNFIHPNARIFDFFKVTPKLTTSQINAPVATQTNTQNADAEQR